MPLRLGTRVLLVAALVTTIGCDRVTKRLATEALAGAPDRTFLADTVRLGYAENSGGFLSVGADLPPWLRAAIFTGGTGVMLLVIGIAAIRFRWQGVTLAGAALFVTGGASNWADRIFHGHVVDFLNVGIGSWRTGVLHVADVAILIGLALFLSGRPRGTVSSPERRTMTP
jgi:signal peptidase II